MPKITARFGVLVERIIHLATDEEIQIIKNILAEVILIKENSENSYRFGWTTFFMGSAVSSFLYIIPLPSNSQYYNLVLSILFFTICLSIYFFWNWRVNKRKDNSTIKSKEQQLDLLFEKIENRVPSKHELHNEGADP